MDYHIIYINLDRSDVRNNNFITSMNKHNIEIGKKCHRISAIDARDIKSKTSGSCDNFNYIIKNKLLFTPRTKEISIILSHIKALNFMIDNNIDLAIIMEDDISFEYISNLDKFINSVLTVAPENWSSIKFHTSSDSSLLHNISLSKNNISFVPVDKSSMQGAVCYAIKKQTAIEIIDKYFNKNTNIYTFPHNNEFCTSECIVFLTGNVYIYTTPYICVYDNNVTCAGNVNISDEKTNSIIHDFWNNKKILLPTIMEKRHIKTIKEQITKH